MIDGLRTVVSEVSPPLSGLRGVSQHGAALVLKKICPSCKQMITCTHTHMLLQMTEFVSGEQVPRGLSFFCSSAGGVSVQGHGQREEVADCRPDVPGQQVRKPTPGIDAHATLSAGKKLLVES